MEKNEKSQKKNIIKQIFTGKYIFIECILISKIIIYIKLI